jgi:Putative transposase
MPDPKSRTLEFMQRLAARMPRPRLHLIRFHGVLAPNAKLRSEIIPSPVSKQPSPHAITRKRRVRRRA